MLTRALAEARLVPRASGWMGLAGMDTHSDGTNPDLDDPLLESLARLGYLPANFAVATDADLGRVPEARGREFLARAELRLLENVASRYTLVSRQVGFQSRFAWGEINLAIQRAIERLRQEIDREWGTVPGGVAVADVVPQASDPCAVARNLRWSPP